MGEGALVPEARSHPDRRTYMRRVHGVKVTRLTLGGLQVCLTKRRGVRSQSTGVGNPETNPGPRAGALGAQGSEQRERRNEQANGRGG
jgi:hypothetical protein